MGPAHPYEGWSGRDLPRWGVLPDMDVPGGDIYTPPLPEGEGVLITNKIPHGAAECHDKYNAKRHSSGPAMWLH